MGPGSRSRSSLGRDDDGPFVPPSFEARKRSHLRMTMLRRRPFGGNSPDCAEFILGHAKGVTRGLHPGYDADAVPVRRRVRE